MSAKIFVDLESFSPMTINFLLEIRICLKVRLLVQWWIWDSALHHIHSPSLSVAKSPSHGLKLKKVRIVLGLRLHNHLQHETVVPDIVDWGPPAATTKAVVGICCDGADLFYIQWITTDHSWGCFLAVAFVQQYPNRIIQIYSRNIGLPTAYICSLYPDTGFAARVRLSGYSV